MARKNKNMPMPDNMRTSAPNQSMPPQGMPQQGMPQQQAMINNGQQHPPVQGQNYGNRPTQQQAPFQQPPRGTQNKQMQGQNMPQQMPNQRQNQNRPPQEQDGNDKSKQPKAKKPITSGKAFGLGLLASLIVFLIIGGGIVGYNSFAAKRDSDSNNAYIKQMQEQYEQQSSFVNITPAEFAVTQAMNSTVPLSIESGTSYAAGLILSSDGYILTNNHAIGSSKNISAEIDGETYTASIIGTDASSDLAVLKIDAKGLTPISIQEDDSDPIRIGKWVMTFGNSFGQGETLAAGYVSALGKDMKSTEGSTDIWYADMIQTTITYNQGGTGAGIFDEKGQCLGVATMIPSQNGASTGIGYAIPIDYALTIAKTICEGKPASHPVLGLSLSTIPADQASQYGLTGKGGAFVTSVTASGPGSKAGIVVNDVITGYDDEKIEIPDDLLFAVRTDAVGSEHELTVLRQGKEMSIKITLGSDV